MNLYEIISWAIVIYYAVVFILSIDNLYHLTAGPHKKCFDRRRLNRSLAILVLIIMIIQSGVYVVLQIQWNWGNYGEEIGEFTDILWLVSEYLAATGFILINLLLSTTIKWRRRVQ